MNWLKACRVLSVTLSYLLNTGPHQSENHRQVHDSKATSTDLKWKNLEAVCDEQRSVGEIIHREKCEDERDRS